MRAIAQWFRDAWSLPWSLKGPFLALSVAVLALVVTVSVIIATSGGSGKTAISGVVQGPTPTATPTPTPTPAPTPTPTPTPTPSPTPPPPPAPPLPPPPPAPDPALTAAEEIKCEGGQFDGWDDGFNVQPYGTTPFPASLTLTTDPDACEVRWLGAYDDGYSRGKTDICSLVNDYIEVSSPEELAFCGLEPPTPAPYLPNLESPGEAIIFATHWMCCDADATLAVAVDNPLLYYSDLFAFPQDCVAEFDINYLWWVVQCEAYRVNCDNPFQFPCPYTIKPLCVSDVDYNNITPCGHVYGY